MPALFQLVHCQTNVIENIYVSFSRYKQHRVKAYHLRFVESIDAWTAEHDGVLAVVQDQGDFSHDVRAGTV